MNTGTSIEKYVKGFAQREISFVMEDFEILPLSVNMIGF